MTIISILHDRHFDLIMNMPVPNCESITSHLNYIYTIYTILLREHPIVVNTKVKLCNAVSHSKKTFSFTVKAKLEIPTLSRSHHVLNTINYINLCIDTCICVTYISVSLSTEIESQTSFQLTVYDIIKMSPASV